MMVLVKNITYDSQNCQYYLRSVRLWAIIRRNSVARSNSAVLAKMFFSTDLNLTLVYGLELERKTCLKQRNINHRVLNSSMKSSILSRSNVSACLAANLAVSEVQCELWWVVSELWLTLSYFYSL